MRAYPAVIAAVLLAGSAAADLKVMDSEDVVHLVTGKEIRCKVLAVGMKAVIVIVEDAEVTIPRHQVASIARGEVRPTVKGYQTEVVNGIKVVVGEGYRDSESAGDGEALAEAGPKAKKGRKVAAKGAPPISKAKIDELMKDPKMSRIVEKLGGRENATKLLRENRNNPLVKKYMEEFRKTGKLPPGLDRYFK